MAVFELATFRQFPQREKDLINGFIRVVQTMFSQESSYHLIPDSINIICGLFYYVTDKWNKNILPSKYSLSDDCRTLKCVSRVAFDHLTAFLYIYPKLLIQVNIIGNLRLFDVQQMIM